MKTRKTTYKYKPENPVVDSTEFIGLTPSQRLRPSELESETTGFEERGYDGEQLGHAHFENPAYYSDREYARYLKRKDREQRKYLKRKEGQS